MRTLPRILPLLCTPFVPAALAAQEDGAIRKPGERVELVATATLLPIARPAAQAETGLAALLEVPGVRATIDAVFRRAAAVEADKVVFREIEDLTDPWAPLERRLDWSLVERFTMAVKVLPPPHVALLVDYAEAHEDEAKAALDAAAADLRRRGLTLETGEPRAGVPVLTNEAKTSRWIARNGRQLVFGVATTDLVPDAAPPPTAGSAALRLGVPLRTEAVAKPLRDVALALGFRALGRFEAELAFDGAGFRERVALLGERADAPSQRPLAEAPALPRLDGQFLVVRANVDPKLWIEPVLAALAGLGLQDEALAFPAGFFEGGLALGVAAPQLGSIFPRVTLAARVRDGDAFVRGLQDGAAAVRAGKLEVKEIDGVLVATRTAPKVPPPLRPSFCVVGDVLLAAETPVTLRALRKAIGTGQDVFADADAVACPPPDGAVVLAEAWFDCEAIWKRSAKTWGTGLLASLLGSRIEDAASQAPPILDAGELPDPEEVARTLGRGRAVFTVTRDELALRVAAPVMGPLHAFAGGVGLAFVPKELAVSMERERRQFAAEASQERFARLGEALRAYRAANANALPPSLDELVPLLPVGDPEPLFAPHDPVGRKREVRQRDGTVAEQRYSFQAPPAGMTAGPVRSWLPGKPRPRAAPMFDPAQPARPVYAFCTAGYLDHHMVLFEDGDVGWVRSKVVLDAILGGKR